MIGGWAQTRTEPPGWVNGLTVAVLTLTLLYLVVGIPEFHHVAEQDIVTDAVDPVHRFGWIALFAAAMPVAAARWRQTAGLLLANWLLLLLYLLFAASVSWALDPAVSLRRFVLSTMQLLQLAVLISGLRRATTLHWLIAGTCIAGATADLLTLAVPSVAFASDGFVGLQPQKNQTGLMMMYGCLSAGTLFFMTPKRLPRVVIGGAVLMMVGLLVLTRSSTSQSVVFLAPVVMPAMLFVARLPRPGVWAVVTALLFVLVGAAFAYLAYCGVTGMDPWLPMRGVTFTQRTDIWSFVVGEIAKRPWLGAGYASFWSIDPAIQPSLKSDDWFGTYAIINEAHNGYLDVLAMNGIVGLAMVVLVLIRSLVLAGPALTRADPPDVARQRGTLAQPTAVFHMALLVGLLVHNFTESSFFVTGLLMTGFLIATLDLTRWHLATAKPPAPPYPAPAPRRRQAARAAEEFAGETGALPRTPAEDSRPLHTWGGGKGIVWRPARARLPAGR